MQIFQNGIKASLIYDKKQITPIGRYGAIGVIVTVLYPDFNLKETEEQKEQRDRQYNFQGLLAEKLLGAAAEHTTAKSADDDGYHQPQIRQIAVHQVAYEGTDTGKTGSDK